MKYNRGNLESTIRAAKHNAACSNEERYILATACGYAIERSPVSWQGYYKVLPTGEVEKHATK
jgi:hypothetical protein